MGVKAAKLRQTSGRAQRLTLGKVSHVWKGEASELERLLPGLAGRSSELNRTSMKERRRTQSHAGRIRQHLAEIEELLGVGYTYAGVIEMFQGRQVDLGSLSSFPKALYLARRKAEARRTASANTSSTSSAVVAGGLPIHPPETPSPSSTKSEPGFTWKGTGKRDDLV